MQSKDASRKTIRILQSSLRLRFVAIAPRSAQGGKIRPERRAKRLLRGSQSKDASGGTLSILRSSLRLHSGRGVLFISTFSFCFHNFMDCIKIAAYQSIFLGARPAFYLSLMRECFMICCYFFAPNQFDRAARESVGKRTYSFLMLPEASGKIVGTTRVVGAIRAFENVNVE